MKEHLRVTGSAQVIVYCGRHYGRPHAILSDNGRVLVAVHLPTGDVVHAAHCDCEHFAPNRDPSDLKCSAA